jgi:hypothetical protein
VEVGPERVQATAALGPAWARGSVPVWVPGSVQGPAPAGVMVSVPAGVMVSVPAGVMVSVRARGSAPESALARALARVMVTAQTPLERRRRRRSGKTIPLLLRSLSRMHVA